MASLNRPARLSVIDETGEKRTLAGGPGAYAAFGDGDRLIFLGLGPDPAEAVALADGRPAAYVECPAFAAAMGTTWTKAIPDAWPRLDPAELAPLRAGAARFYLYRQNTRLFPSFWGPLWARVQLALLPRPESAPQSPTVLLFRDPAGMLEPQLARSLARLGRPVAAIPATDSAQAVAAVLGREKPALALCVNGTGLDDDGLVAELLRAAGVPLVLWFVDNPFHVLGRFRSRFWQWATLCVTDDSFLAPLWALGAGNAIHLPLAASDHFSGASPTPGLSDRAVFVGRSAFAGRDAFFADCRIPEALAGQARDMAEAGKRPDFFWWADHLGLGALWPGKSARQAGCGAETAGLAQRAAVLTAVGEDAPLTVYGDPGWRELLPPGTDVRPPVDYYGALPGLYAGAGVSVNVTSLLLPRGLTQRHFDVWAAGGCLITDATPGLTLFPAKLTAPIRYASPPAAGRLAADLLANPNRRKDLTAAWQEHITAGHRYEDRLAALLASLSVD
ncbi:glycosyltransferase family protein [Desulfovibrio sp. TomC]|uniref:glycosyltransferase family protein n=1 Tax=Desulfovibrio sp. TomC TaxID=1562888 RepID=UPI000575382E|nr:glycosyltransferase [Desulfovibrio sp. TomC]KHK01786.1 CgeB family protein [Desulfovibrio sp. TomC]